MHPLKQYLLEIDETIQDFARRVGTSRQTLYRIIGGRQTPKPALARRIVEATGGLVAFEAFYHGRAVQGEVVGLEARGEPSPLDPNRLKVAIAIVINHLSPEDHASPPDEALGIAAEAVMNTYLALSRITTRRGPDRLKQALRPVIEEILREFAGSPLPASALDRGAELAAQLYFQSQ
ncbi:MAG: helix-turn-helix transcriptional regulator [Alphaproteobacteria bacterium]|nr:helix-turn-helix transcriptional regulator [Alphaproteobacteria bacterium]